MLPAATRPAKRRARSSTHGEAGIAALLDAFRKDFPKTKTSYVRAQTGALDA
jgi:hypothetical protein